ncbi:MAG: type VI secretion system contractile sheath small subunit [Polyangia bacterium]
MAQSIQQVKAKVRAPRVHITYDVETDGAIKMVSLPFVLGIVGAFSGDRHGEKDPAKRLKPFEERKFEDISTVNFDEVMKGAAPSLRFTVENKLQPGSDSKLRVELDFKSMRDFEPEQIAKKLDATKGLLELRQKMHSLLTRLEGQSEADRLLKEVISGSTPSAAAPEANPETKPAE